MQAWTGRAERAEDVVSRIKSGQRVFVHGASATPTTLLDALCNARSFRDLDDLRFQLADWMDRVVDQRSRRIDGRTCLERFADEKPKLVPLPRHPYDTARVAYRLWSIDGFVDWQGNR